MATVTAPVVDAAVIGKDENINELYVWPENEQATSDATEELHVPIIDLNVFVSSDDGAIAESLRLIDAACRSYGFFQIINHGVSGEVIEETDKVSESFFDMPLEEKEKMKRKVGESYGYASLFTQRYSDRLPWKETVTFPFCPSGHVVHQYFVTNLGDEFNHTGKVHQKYCEAMNKLALHLIGILGMSLGVGREFFLDFFQDSISNMRLNNYPPCNKPELTLGTGPHSDPVALTILHQPVAVDGLQVLTEDGKWRAINPKPDAFVVNISDTFMAMTNGKYKSCFHRAVVNTEVRRRSMAFFLCPAPDKVVRASEEFVDDENPRKYPDFTWPEFHRFTQKHHRADMTTLDAFVEFIAEQKKEQTA